MYIGPRIIFEELQNDYAKRVFSIELLLHVYIIQKANRAKCYQCYR